MIDQPARSPSATESPAEVSPRAPTFARGEMLSGRYRIVQFIGHGGMGEVYEAEDVELRERVALKTIRPEIAGDEKSIERFRREISLARRVTHRNVCRMFDLGRHRLSGSGSEAEVTFLTMELLPGETLSARLQRVGRIPTAVAQPLVTQMAAALAAAHRAGIVHRDFKPGNVILVSSSDGALRAVVTDFGLARPDPSVRAPETQTVGSDGVMGTPSYMAPEQLEGAELTPAADIYALGVVIYEMVAGSRPFVGDTPMATAVKRLTEQPPSPRTHVPDLDPRWEGVILKCLEREPAKRFASADDVIAGLEGRLDLPRAEAPRRRRGTLAAVALVLAAAGAAVWLARTPRGSTGGAPATAPIVARPAVAVLAFQNLSQRAEMGWLGAALAEMISWELTSDQRVRGVPGEAVVRLRRDLTFPDATVLTQQTLGQVRLAVGADYVVAGSYLPLAGDPPGQLRVDVVLQDATTAQTLEAASETGREADLVVLVTRCTARLRARLGGRLARSRDDDGLRSFFPKTLPAQRAYFEGLHGLRLSGALHARESLQQALADDPGSPAVHSTLADAWRSLGYHARARQAAEAAFQAAETLPSPVRLDLEARFRMLAGQPREAVEVLGQIVREFPDDVEHGLALGAQEIEAGRPQGALAAVQALRRIPPPAGDDPRIDLLEARAAFANQDDERAQTEAADAAVKAQSRRLPLVAAAARRVEAMAAHRRERAEPALAAAAESARIAAEAGDRAGHAEALLLIGQIQEGRGEVDTALRSFEEARAILRDAGSRRWEAASLAASARIWVKKSDAGRARKTYEEALGIFRDVEDVAGAAATHLEIAELLASADDLAGALRAYDEARGGYRAAGDPAGQVRALLGLGPLHLRAGDRTAAWRNYDAAVALLVERGDERAAAVALGTFASALRQSGDLAGAKRAYGEELAILRRMGDAPATADALGRMAEILALQGDLPASRVMFEETLEVRRSIDAPAARSATLSALAEVQVGQADLTSAARTAEEALRAAQQSGDRGAQGRASHVLGTVFGLRGSEAEARARLDAAVAIRRELGERSGLGDSLLGIASLAVEGGRLPEAESMAREALDVYRSTRSADGEAQAQVVLADVLLRTGRAGPAAAAVSRAQSLATRSESVPGRLSVVLAGARVRAASGEAGAALKDLEGVVAEAQRAGLVLLELEGSVALGQAELIVGRSSQGRLRLEGAEKDATARGLVPLARRASAARK